MTPRFTGAVLTGGASRRLGTDKALLEIDGQALAERSAAALRDAGATEVLAIGGDLDALGRLTAVDRAVPDLHPGEGPLGGVLSAFAAAADDVVVVLACDVPGIAASDVRALLDALNAEPTAAVAHAVVGDRAQPLTAAWRVSRAEDVARSVFAAGERAPRLLFDFVATVPVTTLANSAVDDIDSPADLHRYARPDAPRHRQDDDE